MSHSRADIFVAYSSDDPPDAQIVYLASCILEQADSPPLQLRHRGRRWSTAELRLSEQDVECLREWARGLSLRTRSWLRPDLRASLLNGRAYRRPSLLGLVLLTLFAEIARREASEGELWPHITRFFENAEAYPLLFVPGNRQPTSDLKDAVDSAARAFGLRHVFGIQGMQNWFITVYLQFGLTQRGVRNRLGYWLAGRYPSKAIHLLTGDAPGDPLKSESFETLWGLLMGYRHSLQGEARLRDELQQCPWVLPIWIDDLIAGAKAHRGLGVRHFAAPAIDSNGNRKAPSDAAAGGEAASPEAVFLARAVNVDAPKLVWRPGRPPRFMCAVQAVDALGLGLDLETGFDPEGVRYVVRVADSDEVVLAPQETGAFLPLSGEPLEFAPDAPVVTAQLLADCVGGASRGVGAAIVASRDVLLWDAAEPVAVFNHQGVRLADPWRDVMRPEQSYTLLLAGGLRLLPETAASAWRMLPGNLGALHSLSAGWDPNTVLVAAEVTSEDGNQQCSAAVTVWRPVLQSASPPSPLDYTGEVRGPLARASHGNGYYMRAQVAYGERYWLEVSHSPGAEIEYAAIDGLQVGVAPRGDGKTTIGPAVLVPISWGDSVHAVIVARGEDGRRATLRRCVPVAPLGAAMLDTRRGWMPLGESLHLTVAQAESNVIKLSPPDNWDAGRSRALVEDGAWMANAASGRPLRELGGYGGRLAVTLGRFNSQEDPMVIAGEVRDPGIVAGMRVIAGGSDDDSQLCVAELSLARHIEPDERHRAVIFYESGRHEFAPVNLAEDECGGDQPSRWKVVCAGRQPGDRVAAIGIAYRGERLGCGWSGHWSRRLPDCSPARARVAAALIRWLKLPVLSGAHRDNVVGLASNSLPYVIEAWLCDEHLPGELAHGESGATSEAWLSAIAELLSQCSHPSQSQARQCYAAFDQSLPNMAESLLRVHPYFMVYMVLAVLGDVAEAQGVSAADQALRTLLRELAGVDAPGEIAIARSLADLREQCCLELRRDPKFLDNLLRKAEQEHAGQRIEAVHQRNIRVMLRSMAPLRRLIGIELLQHASPAQALRAR